MAKEWLNKGKPPKKIHLNNSNTLISVKFNNINYQPKASNNQVCFITSWTVPYGYGLHPKEMFFLSVSPLHDL